MSKQVQSKSGKASKASKATTQATSKASKPVATATSKPAAAMPVAQGINSKEYAAARVAGKLPTTWTKPDGYKVLAKTNPFRAGTVRASELWPVVIAHADYKSAHKDNAAISTSFMRAMHNAGYIALQ